jgi:hypothetical protein
MTPLQDFVGTARRALSLPMTPPWIVRAWSPVVWPIQGAPGLDLVHLGTRVVNAGSEAQPRVGQTLWGSPVSEGSAGVAWDWIELRPGVFVMSDPLGLVTNLQLVDANGEVLSGLQAALRLNQIVNLLPWQDVVTQVLRQEQSGHATTAPPPDSRH